MAHSEPTKAFLNWSPETAMLSAPFGAPTYLPLSHPEAEPISKSYPILKQILSPKPLRSLQEMT